MKEAEYKRLGLPYNGPTTTPVVRKDTTTRKLNLRQRKFEMRIFFVLECCQSRVLLERLIIKITSKHRQVNGKFKKFHFDKEV